jgi:two-component system NtrC family sensor kinase
MFAKAIKDDRESFFPLQMRDEPFLFAASPVKWGDSGLIVGLGASKQKSKAALKSVTSAFFTVVAAMLLLLALSGVLIARIVLRPLNGLVDAIQAMDQGGAAVEIPVSTDTEIGSLTEAFNDMSRRVAEARADLEKKIEELRTAYSELKDTQARLVHAAKMASLGQLVAGVAHELNNPIGFIYSNMEHLRDYSGRLLKMIEGAEEGPKKLAALKKELDYDYIVQDLPRLVQSCEDGARRTRDIVLGLRSFSRLEEAKLKKVDLREGVENTLRLLAGELKARIEVHVDFERLPKIPCYASQLNQVFMNILANAAQAIADEGEIWVTGRREGDRAIVSIRDSGKGMDQETADRIFDPFFTTKGIGQGTGLGLSISYGIVKKHGGELLVKSERGKGTEFTISLPIAGPPGEEADSAAG